MGFVRPPSLLPARAAGSLVPPAAVVLQTKQGRHARGTASVPQRTPRHDARLPTLTNARSFPQCLSPEWGNSRMLFSAGTRVRSHGRSSARKAAELTRICRPGVCCSARHPSQKEDVEGTPLKQRALRIAVALFAAAFQVVWQPVAIATPAPDDDLVELSNEVRTRSLVFFAPLHANIFMRGLCRLGQGVNGSFARSRVQRLRGSDISSPTTHSKARDKPASAG